jgi:hypothetical protein
VIVSLCFIALVACILFATFGPPHLRPDEVFEDPDWQRKEVATTARKWGLGTTLSFAELVGKDSFTPVQTRCPEMLPIELLGSHPMTC